MPFMTTRTRQYPHGTTERGSTLADDLEGGLFLLDGATGTELERRGLDCSLPLWSAQALLDAPETVEAVHRDYVAAGVDCLTANTFRTQARVLGRAGLGDRAHEFTVLAIALARRAAQGHPGIRVAGSAAPLEDCYRPDLVPPLAALEREHGEHCAALAAGGADLILIETMGTVREAQAAAAAAAATGLPVLVSLIGGPHGTRLLSGEPIEAALEAIAASSPQAVLINCMPVSQLDVWWPALQASGLAFGVYPNLGTPGDHPLAARSEELGPEAFAAHARRWVECGASIVGGCCGTGPAHLQAVHAALRGGSANTPE